MKIELNNKDFKIHHCWIMMHMNNNRVEKERKKFTSKNQNAGLKLKVASYSLKEGIFILIIIS